MGGLTNLERDYISGTRTEHKLSSLYSAAPQYAIDLRAAYIHAGRSPKILMVYGTECESDRRHAEHMGGLVNIELIPLEDCADHNVHVYFIAHRLLPMLLDRMLSHRANEL